MTKPTLLPPFPWAIEENRSINGRPYSGFVYLVDANGAKIAVLYGQPAVKEAMAEFLTTTAPVLDDTAPTPA